jgi:multidrug efflux pump
VSISAPFIKRPVATTLLTVGLVLAGALAYVRLPVSPLPQVDFPTISVQASLPGASPDTVATSVASPLERHLGQIANVTEMTSRNSTGASRITLQFGLDRDIDGAARDVQAAINAARADLPSSLRSNPVYRKVNPADAPVIILALTSTTLSRGQMYDSASNVLQQRISQVAGVGQVTIGGAALPAVRVELNPQALFKYGIGLEDVRAALASANANAPKGAIEDGERRLQIYTNDQATKASDYAPLVVAYRNGAAVQLSDVAEVLDGVEDVRNLGLFNGNPAVLVFVFRQPGANIIDTVDRVRALLPQLTAALPAEINVDVAQDRTTTIRASLNDTLRTLVISAALVVGVVMLFLGEWRAALVPLVAVPASIIATFAAMYLLGYSLDNFSLMALTIATGFVVDDAVVVLENITRYIEAGMKPVAAALKGAGEVAFTVLSISISLIAVFLPVLLMGGLVGRLFREFALTLSLAIVISLVISLTTTPCMCALLLRQRPAPSKPRRSLMDRMGGFYARSLSVALDHSRLVMVVLALTIGLNVWLFIIIPKGLFPQQDTGRLIGAIQGDQSISFQAMSQKLRQMAAIVQADPAVASVVGFSGNGGNGMPDPTNTAEVFVALKPLAERDVSVDQVIARLRGKLGEVTGARLFLQGVQDIRVGGRSSNAQYQYTLQADTAAELYEWGPPITTALQADPMLADVNSDQQQGGIQTNLIVDRPTAARLGLSMSQIDNTLYDAFGQRQVSTIYKALNQYHVVMEIAPRWLQDPQMLAQIWVSTAGGAASGTQSSNTPSGLVAKSGATSAALSASAARNAAINSIGRTGKSSASSGSAVSTSKETMIPLSAFARWERGNTPLQINHQGQFVASTISFNLPPGVSLSDAQASVEKVMSDLRVPTTIHGAFAGTAQAFAASLANEPYLIAAALAAVYLVLGILYESLVHPLTIISTLPSAGLGAVVALMITHTDFSIIALIGVILLIGIVKKNAIMMIDFALQAERERGLDSRAAIVEACRLRFRPIIMTTAAALLGAIPLMLGHGDGSEIRYPLGISIVGGLVVSQILTLYTTPVVYLYLDRFRLWAAERWVRNFPDTAPEPAE